MTSSQIIQTPSAGDNGSRKNDTTIQGYHQIVAVSQNNINASLKFQFLKQNTLREIEFLVNDEGTMKATMNPPTVKLIPNTEQHKVIFYLHFKEGTFEYWTGHGPNSKKQEQRIDNWTLAFTVNLNLLELDQQGVPKEIQDRIKVSDLYSVSQLLLGFQTSDIGKFDYDESRTPNFDLHLAMNEKLYLNMYLDKYLRKLNAGSHNILGYAITIKDPKVFNEEAPSFPPTDLQFQTYEYRPIGYDNISRNDGYNMLLFLGMTQNRPMPPVALSWSGNWLIPNMAGTMAISKENFWKRYLLPKLSVINRAMSIIITEVTEAGCKWKFGDEAVEAANEYPWELGNTGAAFNHKSEKVHKENEVVYLKATGTSYANHSIKWTAGSNVITCNGKSSLKYYYTSHATTRFHMAFRTWWCEAIVDWKFDFTLNSVHNGGLEINVSKPEVNADSWKHGDIVEEFLDRIIGLTDDVRRDFVKSINEHFKVDVWASEMEKALNRQQHFVFPGGGTFDMKNPIFNKEGDLMVEISYKVGA